MTTSSLKWALLGASDIAATRMIPAFRAVGQEVAIVQSGDARWAAEYARVHGIPASTSSVDEAVLHAGVDAVYVSSHNHKHREQVLAAAAAGRHVLAEKPLALTVDDGREMVAACEHAGVVLATNHHLPASPTHRAMKRAVQDGAIGTVRAVRVSHAGYLPERLRTWRLEDPIGGGVLFDVFVHDLAAISAIVGGQALRVGSLSRTSSPLSDSVMSVVTWDGDVLVETHDAYDNPHLPTSLSILGTEGAILAADCMTGDPIGGVLLYRDMQAENVDLGQREDLYTVTARAFAAAVSEGTPPLVTGLDGVRALAGAIAARASLMSGRVEDVERI